MLSWPCVAPATHLKEVCEWQPKPPTLTVQALPTQSTVGSKRSCGSVVLTTPLARPKLSRPLVVGCATSLTSRAGCLNQRPTLLSALLQGSQTAASIGSPLPMALSHGRYLGRIRHSARYRLLTAEEGLACL